MYEESGAIYQVPPFCVSPGGPIAAFIHNVDKCLGFGIVDNFVLLKRDEKAFNIRLVKSDIHILSTIFLVLWIILWITCA